MLAHVSVHNATELWAYNGHNGKFYVYFTTIKIFLIASQISEIE